MLTLQLFGLLSASWCNTDNAPHRIILSGRPGSLLAFLALSRGQFFNRSDLMMTLWGDRSDSGNIGSFNTTLWRLRRAVGKPPVGASGGQSIIACSMHGAVGMPEDADCVLDVERFEKLVLPPLAKPIERLSSLDIEQLREGINFYKDDLLAGFSEEWALRHRERQRRHYLNSLGRLMQVSSLARDYASAITYAQSILDRDMLREDVHRELMRLLLANGQRALALRQFERCRDALRVELAVPPMPETMTLYRQIAARAMQPDREVTASALGVGFADL